MSLFAACNRPGMVEKESITLKTSIENIQTKESEKKKTEDKGREHWRPVDRNKQMV